MGRDVSPLSIAMIGTRGVPAAYGGFETAVEEIGARLADRGHRVLVYCRSGRAAALTTWRGMELVHLPALRMRSAETLSHTAASVLHLARTPRPDVALVFNAANSPFVPFLRWLGIPVAVHVDGLEWMREKWSGAGRAYYRFAERFAVRHADALIADAQGIADYYHEKFGAATELLTYGTRVITSPSSWLLGQLGLRARGFHLVVARFEPENHVEVIVEGYRRSSASLPLVVVGSAPYSARYTDAVTEAAAADPRIRLLGGVWDQQLLDELYSNALTYLHGHSVGGTNPSLLRAMGGATKVIAWDIGFNREVAGASASYFDSADAVSGHLHTAELDPAACMRLGHGLQERAAAAYNWEDVTTGYEDLARHLVTGRPSPATRTPSPHDTELRLL